LVTAPAALPPESRPALSSSRGGSRDRAAYGSRHSLHRRPGVPAARRAGCGPAAAAGLPGSRAVSPEDVVYGIARVDSSGRICERAVIAALGWAGGDLLTFTADAGVVTARRDPAGMVTLPASGYITIPAALRRRCGLEAGDQVLLAALPDQDSLAAYSLAVVDQAIRAHGSFQHLQGGRP
jgi:hypothetical protein